MNWNRHSNLEGQHAFMSASKYHWVNYSNEKLIQSYINWQAAQRGTELHDFARKAIELGIKLPRSSKTLNMYVNDAIGYRMQPEQVLYYSRFCFGTCDAISFRDRKLRIHDLKTGSTPTSIVQVRVYAAIFCLEYCYNPEDIEIELRIYQNDEVLIEKSDPADIRAIMNTIKEFNMLLEDFEKGG